MEDVDEEKQDASYFNFGGFSHDDMHPTLERNGSGSVPNTKSIKVIFHINFIIVKLRSRSRSDECQVRVGKVKETKDLDLRYTIFLVFTTTTQYHHHKLFSWLLRGLDRSDGLRMGWYDFSMVREG